MLEIRYNDIFLEKNENGISTFSKIVFKNCKGKCLP
jgi:hypothetical protein